MADILFLTVEEVLILHADAITFAGGTAELRSIDLLEGAIAQPEASFGGVRANEFPFGMAAAYAYHLARNHAFVDGNKRAALQLGTQPLRRQPCADESALHRSEALPGRG